MRSDGNPQYRSYATHQVVNGEGFTEVYDLAMTRNNRVAAKRRYEVLTHENFARIGESVEGYQTILKHAPTDPALRAWYREALVG